MITAWRIVSVRFQEDAFSGEGAKLRGGRWNSKGTSMVYTSGSLALASIEMLVNLPRPKLLENFVRIPARIPSRLIVDLTDDRLPSDWSSRPVAPTTRTVGDRWVKQKTSAVLKVPSVVIPEEYNYLINPNHPDFEKITIGPPNSYWFDPRLSR